jgi:hypothetical protein
MRTSLFLFCIIGIDGAVYAEINQTFWATPNILMRDRRFKASPSAPGNILELSGMFPTA